MHPSIRIVMEHRRGCGFRDKPGRLYLRYNGEGQGCGRLPIPLEVCPTCGAGIRISRAAQMLETPWHLWQHIPCKAPASACVSCPASIPGPAFGPALLLWIGEQYYQTPADFEGEAARMGISRFIHHVPRGFEVGRTWVLLAHGKAIVSPPRLRGEAHLHPRYLPHVPAHEHRDHRHG